LQPLDWNKKSIIKQTLSQKEANIILYQTQNTLVPNRNQVVLFSSVFAAWVVRGKRAPPRDKRALKTKSHLFMPCFSLLVD
jgi:hypothetical protein